MPGGYSPGTTSAEGRTVVKHKELVNSVAEHVELGAARARTQDTTDELREIITAVLSTLAHTLTDRQRHELADALPGTVEDAALVPADTAARDGNAMVTELAQRLGVTAERARYLAQAVFAGLADADRTVTDFLREHATAEIVAVLEPSGDSPERVASTRAEVPTELSEEDLTRALNQLTGWERDQEGISRTVSLPADRVTPLIERVQREAARGNDHARAQRTADGVTFTLRTGRSGTITQPDVSLAERIDQAVAEVGSGGRPGR